MPPPSFNDTQLSSLRSKPVIIPFDGAYWYFKQPDQRPKDDAPTVRGDPLSKNIRSNMRPLSMEAHQNLNTSIKVDFCRTLRWQFGMLITSRVRSLWRFCFAIEP